MTDQLKNMIVTQSNKLVEARYSLTVGEQRLILSMISMISPDDEDFRKYDVKVVDLARCLNLSNKNIYEQMELIIQRLMGRVLHIPEPKGFFKTHWVSSARYNRDEGTVTLTFDPELKPYLIRLKEQFTKYQLTMAAQFQSAYTIRIYGLLKQYETIGVREFLLSELREILGIDTTDYLQYKEFKRWVIGQAKKELDSIDDNTGHHKSDISFTLEEIREARKVHRLRFIIVKHFDLSSQDALCTEEPPLLTRLKHYGISDTEARKFLQEKGEQAIEAVLVLYEKRLHSGQVKDPNGGYLATLLRTDAGQDAPYVQAPKQKRAVNKSEIETDRAKKAAEIEKIEAFLAALSPDARVELQNDFLAQHQGNMTIMRPFRRQGFASKTVQAQFRSYVRQTLAQID
jgi:plasmid replication initiation protein